MTHPIEQAADAVERELADLRAKLAVAVEAMARMQTLKAERDRFAERHERHLILGAEVRARAEKAEAERDAARDAALEEAAKVAKELLEDEGIDLQAISDGYVDALSCGVHGGRKIPRDFAKTCADRFKERSDAVYQMGGHVAAAIRALKGKSNE